MGLDMYLYLTFKRKKDVLGKEAYAAGYSWMEPEQTAAYRNALYILKLPADVCADAPSAHFTSDLHKLGRKSKSSAVCVTVAYWRKANAIHQWFVNNVQGGEDECNPYVVTKKQLEQLQETCLAVLKDPNKAQELLPTQSGFFFGPTELGDYYFECLEETVTQIAHALKFTCDGYAYCSSW